MGMSFLQPDGNQNANKDELARFIGMFRARPMPSVVAKLDILLQLHRFNDPRIAPFLLAVTADPSEPNEVRIDALKRLGDGPQFAPFRRSAVEVILQILREGASLDLRVQATRALAELIDVEGVLTTLGDLVLDPAEAIDVRYAAFSSLEWGSPNPKCVDLLRQLTADETFGPSAKSLLSQWNLP